MVSETLEKMYRDAFQVEEGSRPFSEISGNQAVGIFKILPHGAEILENAIALTKMEAEQYMERGMYVWTLLAVHRAALQEARIPYDADWIQNTMKAYAYNINHKSL